MRRLLFAGGLCLVAGTAAAVGEDAVPALDARELEAGRSVYGRYCASCHGKTGEGAPNWRQLDDKGELPAPPHGPDGHTWRHSDGDLYDMVAKGWRDPFNKTARLTMPGFADALSPAEMVAVVAYLKSLWTDDQRLFQWQESQDQPFPPEARQTRR